MREEDRQAVQEIYQHSLRSNMHHSEAAAAAIEKAIDISEANHLFNCHSVKPFSAPKLKCDADGLCDGFKNLIDKNLVRAPRFGVAYHVENKPGSISFVLEYCPKCGEEL